VASASWFGSAGWFAGNDFATTSWSDVTTTTMLVEQFAQHALYFGSATWFCTRIDNFATARISSDFATTSWLSNHFATTSWLSNHFASASWSCIAALVVLVEKFVKQAELFLAARIAARSWFAAHWLSNYFAATDWLCTSGITSTLAAHLVE
jgi:hypothetical protein